MFPLNPPWNTSKKQRLILYHGCFFWLFVNFLTAASFQITYVLSGLNSKGLLPPWVSWVLCDCATVPSRVQNFFSWIFRASEVFSRGYFVGPDFFAWVFRGSKIISCGCFVSTSWICKWGIRITRPRTPAPINTE